MKLAAQAARQHHLSVLSAIVDTTYPVQAVINVMTPDVQLVIRRSYAPNALVDTTYPVQAVINVILDVELAIHRSYVPDASVDIAYRALVATNATTSNQSNQMRLNDFLRQYFCAKDNRNMRYFRNQEDLFQQIKY